MAVGCPGILRPTILRLVLLITIGVLWSLWIIGQNRPEPHWSLRTHKFNYTAFLRNNPQFCSSKPKPDKHNGTGKSVLIVIPSTRTNGDRRILIRETWGSYKKLYNITYLGVVFFIGHYGAPDEDSEYINYELDVEQSKYQDLVSGDLLDNYQNLTAKSMMMLTWVTRYCPSVDFVVKTDDDVVLNIFHLTQELTKLNGRRSEFHCTLHRGEVPVRATEGKTARYYVPPDQFPDNKFPDHCAGLGWITPIRVVQRFVKAFETLKGPICTHEDVFITGVVRISLVNIRIVDKMNEWFRWNHVWTDEHLVQRGVQDKLNETEPDRIFDKVYKNIIFFLLDDMNAEKFDSVFKITWSRVLRTANGTSTNISTTTTMTTTTETVTMM